MTPDFTGATEQRLRAAVESSPSGLLMTDAQGAIVLVNREVERLFGYAREELLGKPVDTLLPAALRAHHVGHRAGFLADPRVRAMGAGRDLFGMRKDGTEIPLEIGLTPVATEEGMFVLASVVDISARRAAGEERSRLEDELRQAQRIEALGTLAGGIAHDFNNILFGIVGYAELIGKAPSRDQAAADLAELMKAAHRGRELVERIMAFTRSKEVERHPLELGPVIEEAARLLRATLPPPIDLRVSVHPGVPRVRGDVTAFHQVLMNLGTNAAHAMPGGGVLEVTVMPMYLRDSVVRAHPGLHEGMYALLIVKDSGTGMPREVRDRAFEPFYTTKPRGSGTGLGLSIVHSIVRSHEGAIDLASEAGTGTTVTCYFPALAASVLEERRTAETAPQGRGERVLLVEDEASLVKMNTRRLESLGYRVSGDTEPVRALETFRSRPRDFDVVLSDYLMPGMVGLELAREIHRIRADVPILLLTGYIENLPAETIRAAGVRRVLAKPASLYELAVAIQAVLTGSRAV